MVIVFCLLGFIVFHSLTGVFFHKGLFMKKTELNRKTFLTAALTLGLCATGVLSASEASAQSLAWPFPGCTNITSPYGPRGSNGYFHSGIDIACGSGFPIVAAASGTVTYVNSGAVHCNYSSYYGTCPSCSNSAGNQVRITHKDGKETRYLHLQSINVAQGDTVQCGQQIGIVGNTGCSTGPHLHFEVRVNSNHKNPLDYVTKGAKCQCSCGSKTCGDDGCGGSCGTCKTGLTCTSGSCKCQATEIAGGGVFKDIKAGSDEEKIAVALKDNGITAGCNESPLMFCPNCDLTREQTAIFVGRLMGFKYNDETCDNPFSDVTSSTVTPESCYYISQLKKKGIVNGDGTGFKPKNPATRGAAALILAAGLYNIDSYKNASQSFADVPKTHWAFRGVEALASKCVTVGCSVNTFCVDDNITRMQFATMIARAKGFVKAPNCTPAECDFSEQPSCSGNKVKSCINGKYDYADCGDSATCKQGVCEENPSECNDSEPAQCEGNNIKKCVGGKYTIQSSCPNACSNGTCVDCSDSEPAQCEGNNIKKCVGGKYTIQTTCSNACSNGQCIDCLGTEQPQCEGNAIKICSGGQYLKQSCPNKCSNGACVECLDNETPFCDGNNIKKCSGGKYTNVPCSSGETCSQGKCEKQTSCDPSIPKSCDGNNAVSCSASGQIINSSCGSRTCSNGECVDCTSAFVPDCVGDSIRSCSNNSFSYSQCVAPKICLNGTCQDTSDTTCTDTTPKCNGTNVQTCVNGQYTNTPCGAEQICYEGECIDCISASFSPTCHGNAIRICDNNHFKEAPCGTDQICSGGACVDNKECTAGTPAICENDTTIKSCSDQGSYEMSTCPTGQKCDMGKCIEPSTPPAPEDKTNPDDKTDPDDKTNPDDKGKDKGKTDPDDPDEDGKDGGDGDPTASLVSNDCSIGNGQTHTSALWLFLTSIFGLGILRRRKSAQR